MSYTTLASGFLNYWIKSFWKFQLGTEVMLIQLLHQLYNMLSVISQNLHCSLCTMVFLEDTKLPDYFSNKKKSLCHGASCNVVQCVPDFFLQNVEMVPTILPEIEKGTTLPRVLFCRIGHLKVHFFYHNL